MLKTVGVFCAAFTLAVAGFTLSAMGGSKDTLGVTAAENCGYMKGYETLTWAPAADASGYALYRDGTQVSTGGASATSTRFLIQAGNHCISAVPLFPAATTAPASTTTQTTTTSAPATTTAPTTTTGSSGTVWPDTTPPAFTPNRVASTVSEFNTIMGSLKPGDVVEVKPMTLSGEMVFGQKLSAPADVHFDDGVKFTGAAAGTNLPAVWVHGSNLRLYGGDVSGLGNDCVRVGAASSDSSGPTNIRWWGAKLHDCGGSGFSAQASTYPNSNLDISVEIWNAGQNLALDPHAVKGSGLHGAYIGGGNAATTGRFVFYVHDQPTGAAVQAGANLQNADLWIRAERLTWAGQAGYGGNAFQPWGGNNTGVVVHDLEASDVSGRAVFDESLTGGSVTVEYARASGVALSPVYESSPYLGCLDCK